MVDSTQHFKRMKQVAESYVMEGLHSAVFEWMRGARAGASAELGRVILVKRNARRPDLSPRSLAGTRGGGASVAVLALAQQQQQQDDEADIPTEVQDEGDETPPRRRLLHAHPALDGSGTDHWPHGAPQTTKAKSRRLAAQLHRMLRGSDLTP